MVGVLKSAPDLPGVFHHRHGRGVPMANGRELAGGRRVWLCPGAAVVPGPADYDLAIFLGGANGINGTAMHKKIIPKAGAQSGDSAPSRAAIRRTKNFRYPAFRTTAFRAKKIMRHQIFTIRQNDDARRAEVAARGGRAMVNHHAGNFLQPSRINLLRRTWLEQKSASDPGNNGWQQSHDEMEFTRPG